MGVTIVLWIRVFSVRVKPFTRSESVLLLILSGVILFLSVLNLFYLDASILMFFFTPAFALGLLAGVGIFTYIYSKA
jgi:hypothetical protein